MNSELRITGEWPSPELLKRFPNWENALDEEGLEGQDETTLRPSVNQTVIEKYVPFSGGIARLNNGQECPAIIELYLDIGVGGLNFQSGGQWYRIVRVVDRFEQFDRWEPYVEEWLPVGERSPSVSLSDEQYFPLQFLSYRPYYRNSMPIRTTILPDGGEEI